MTDEFVVGGRTIKSRFIHGTGKFPSNEILVESLKRSGSDMVTVAVRRLNLEGGGANELAGIDFSQYTMLPNTAGATTADQAIRIARLARAAGLSDFIKVEVIGDDETLLPDPVETLRATKVLAEEGFIVMTYTSDDVVLAMRLAEAGSGGCRRIMVGSPGHGGRAKGLITLPSWRESLYRFKLLAMV
jgi:thiazole synthase